MRHKRPGPPILQRIDTSPVGFAVFERVLLSVHPDDCAVREAYASRLLNATGDKTLANDIRSAGARGVPLSPADMMLRIVSQMVDAYLDLRRELSRQLDHWQAELLHPRTRFRCRPGSPCTNSKTCATTNTPPCKAGMKRWTTGWSVTTRLRCANTIC
jgi:Mg2+ and Co2+ transporter CorA